MEILSSNLIYISDYAYRHVGKYSAEAYSQETFGFLIGLGSNNLIFSLLPVGETTHNSVPLTERYKYLEFAHPYMLTLIQKFSLSFI